jgi:hypothetical protein
MEQEEEDLLIYEEWVNHLLRRGHSLGCFFLFGETLYPYFWETPYSPRVSLTDAWDVLCRNWLFTVYNQDLTLLYPYILKGVVEPNKIILGNDCPFYLDEIKFNFNLNFTDYEVNPNLAIQPNISPALAVLMRLALSSCPYFESLPTKIQFHKKDHGANDLEKHEALNHLINKAKAKRFGSLPNLIKI